MNEVTLLVIASGLNFIWGFTIFYSIYDGDCKLRPFWIVFGTMLMILGIFIPLEFLINKSFHQIMDNHLKVMKDLESLELLI